MTLGKGRRGIKSKQLLNDLKEASVYYKVKEEEVCHTVQRTRFGRICGLSSDILRDYDYAFEIFGTRMSKIYAEITKNKQKKCGENVCVLVALLCQGTIFYNAVNSDRCLVTLTKSILLLEHQSVHYALCSMEKATQAKVFFNMIQETFGCSVIVQSFP
jgi:hypothetical protein